MSAGEDEEMARARANYDINECVESLLEAAQTAWGRTGRAHSHRHAYRARPRCD